MKWSLAMTLALVTSTAQAAEPTTGSAPSVPDLQQAAAPPETEAAVTPPTAVMAVGAPPAHPSAPTVAIASAPPPALGAAPAQESQVTRSIFTPRVDGGVMFMEGLLPSAYARLGAGSLVQVGDSHDENGWFLGGWDAFEGWGGAGSGGFALPLFFEVSYRVKPARFSLDVGANLFTVDSEKADGEDGDAKTGGGMMSPRACLRLGFEAEPIYIAVQGEGQRRWRWGLPDRWAAQTGLDLGVVVYPERE